MKTKQPGADTDVGMAMAQAYRSIATILDGIDALVTVTDLESGEALFYNHCAQSIWGESDGQLMQRPGDRLASQCVLDEQGEPTGVKVHEFQHPENGRWYQAREQIIDWVDGRRVRVEIATDISERVSMEQELLAAKAAAEKLARTDHLTGVFNRRAFFEQGGRMLSEARRIGYPVSVIMFDIDHFKQINDTYGHAAGDDALKQVALRVSEIVREVDVMGRLGGEEFALILPDTSRTSALLLAERLRQGLHELNVHCGSARIPVTASFGVVARSGPLKTLEQLICAADHAMYRAKQAGRDRVMVGSQAQMGTAV